ncbi:MAG: ankyrin repeat domain-containing protein [Planctomycetota bacterium]
MFIAILLCFNSAVHASELHDAIRAGDHERVRALIEAGADLSEIDTNGEDPLATAMWHDNARAAAMLLDAGANFVPSRHGEVLPLLLFIKRSDLTLQYLQQHRGSLQYGVAQRALLFGASKGALEVVQELVVHQDIHDLDDENVHHALAFAAGDNQVAPAKWLLEHGAEPLHVVARQTAMERAAEEGARDVIELFIAHGVDPHGLTESGKCYVEVALASVVNKIWIGRLAVLTRNAPPAEAAKWVREQMKPRLDVARFLLNQPGDPGLSLEHKNRALHRAARTGAIDVMQMLINQGAEPAYVDDSGRTLIHHAMWANDLSAIQFVESLGFTVLRPADKNGITALHCAVRAANRDAVLYCLDHGVSIEAALTTDIVFDPKGEDQLTAGSRALHLAAEQAWPDIVRLLVEHGASANAQTDHGETPLLFASYHRADQSISLLLDADADVDLANRDGLTPLMVYRTPIDPIPDIYRRMALRTQAVNATDGEGRTALIHMISSGPSRAIEALLDLGADPTILPDDGRSLRDRIDRRNRFRPLQLPDAIVNRLLSAEPSP